MLYLRSQLVIYKRSGLFKLPGAFSFCYHENNPPRYISKLFYNFFFAPGKSSSVLSAGIIDKYLVDC